jgi:hypothetical protein
VKQANDLRVENGSLVAEIHMLRDALERTESDRVRLQAFSSGIMGRLLAINDTIAGAVKFSIKEGVEAAEEHETAKEQPVAEAAEPAQRVSAPTPLPPPAGIIPSPRRPHEVVGRLADPRMAGP